jgi:hypothetical protein
MRNVVVLFAALLTFSGCASGAGSLRAAGDAEGAAAPGPELVGTWTGTAFGAPGSLYGISAPVELTIKPDGTWSWSKRGQQQATGRVRVRGDRVFLDEDTAKEGAQTIQLQRRGEHLWGLSRAFVPETISAVDLQKTRS